MKSYDYEPRTLMVPTNVESSVYVAHFSSTPTNTSNNIETQSHSGVANINST